MRLWSLHPEYLDVKGLVAAWREGLLAQKVLAGQTRGYTRHPQLERFIAMPDSLAAISRYLHALVDEADCRGYTFNRSKIAVPPCRGRMPVPCGQIRYELLFLESKLTVRDPERLRSLLWKESLVTPETARLNPAFRPVPGSIAAWERNVRDF
jgi:Pyrimidine dimer DNA glycosylase